MLALPYAAGALLSVACSAPDACTAVGLDRKHGHPSLALRWNGARWTVQHDAAPKGAAVQSVACPQAQACMAVGSSQSKDGGFAGPPVAERWDGTRWQRVTAGLPSDGVLFDIDCRAPDQCTAVGQAAHTKQPLAVRWDGSRWARIVTPHLPRAPSRRCSTPSRLALFPDLPVDLVRAGRCLRRRRRAAQRERHRHAGRDGRMKPLLALLALLASFPANSAWRRLDAARRRSIRPTRNTPASAGWHARW